MKPQIVPIGMIWKSEANGWVYHRGGLSPCICCGQHVGVQPKINEYMAKIYRIRKLTPRECGRLMGCCDSDLDKMIHYPYIQNQSGEWVLPQGITETMAKKMKISESQLYKCFGNSIVVQVLEGIFTQLFRIDDGRLF